MDRESTETIEDSQFSTKTSISADEPLTQCVKYIWFWKELITSLRNCRVLEKKYVPATFWESGKNVYLRSFEINEWMAIWLATEGYCV